MKLPNTAHAVRDVLRKGSKGAADIIALLPKHHVKTIRRALIGMEASGAIRKAMGRYTIDPGIRNEDDYRKFLRKNRSIKDNPDPMREDTRDSPATRDVGALLRMAW